MRKIILLYMLFTTLSTAIDAQPREFDCTAAWLQKIEKLAPHAPEVQPQETRKILIFDLQTGYQHWVTPHTSQVVKILGEKSGAFQSEITADIYCFETENLEKYDAVVLNNNCSAGPRRNLFLDILDKDENLSEEQRKAKADELEANLISYVEKGRGLMVIHGGITMQNNSMAFSTMVGGSFDYHPKQQELSLKLVDAKHPLVKAFEGKDFIHIDEPYLFNKAYQEKNFRPLLYIDTDNLSGKKKPIEENIRYVSWIKKQDKGRVFFVSPAHNAQSFEDIRLLRFFLDGAQYVLGDLKCDDSPMGL